MLVVSAREFREHQKSYLDKLDEGLELLIQRGKNKCYKITPVKEDDTLMSKEDFFSKIDLSLQQINEGKGIKVSGKDELKKFLDKL